MIHLHSWDTSNGRKVFILLQELGLPYGYYPIDIIEDTNLRRSFWRSALSAIAQIEERNRMLPS